MKFTWTYTAALFAVVAFAVLFLVWVLHLDQVRLAQMQQVKKGQPIDEVDRMLEPVGAHRQSKGSTHTYRFTFPDTGNFLVVDSTPRREVISYTLFVGDGDTLIQGPPSDFKHRAIWRLPVAVAIALLVPAAFAVYFRMRRHRMQALDNDSKSRHNRTLQRIAEMALLLIALLVFLIILGPL